MTMDKSCTLLVIGGGLAGLVAGTRALELGQKVILVESGVEDRYLCNSRLSGGVFHVAYDDVTADAAKLRRSIETATGGHADKDLAEALSGDAGRAVKWLSQHGARFINGGVDPWMTRVLTPPGLQRAGLNWKGRGGDVFLHDLATRFASLGGQMLTGTRAVDLIVKDNRVAGAVVERGGKREDISARSVLIADGGFQGNAELVRRYITARPDLMCMRNAGTGMGDGLLMAQAVGAALVNMESFYGHVQCLDAIGNDDLWPYPVLDHLTTAGIIVDATGKRFTDEGLGGVATANAIARLDRPDGAVVIFDEAIWQSAGKSRRVPPNPNVLEAGVKLISAPNADQLAAQLGMEPGPLGETIKTYSEAIVSSRPATLSPARSDGNSSAKPLNGTLHALRAAAGITYTMGGIATDAHGRVRHGDGTMIEGLFAAGSAAGGLEGGPITGYVGGLTKAAVFGLRAAEYVAEAAKTR